MNVYVINVTQDDDIPCTDVTVSEQKVPLSEVSFYRIKSYTFCHLFITIVTN